MSRSVVSYFSITGVTESVSRMLAEAIGADIFEITPEEPYHALDLNEADHFAEGDCQPHAEVVFTHQNIDDYDRLYVGLPIWWYAAPTIISNFLEGYDLTGKTVIPFATSGGGGIDKVRPRLLASCPGADLKEATLLTAEWSMEELAAWAAQYEK